MDEGIHNGDDRQWCKIHNTTDVPVIPKMPILHIVFMLAVVFTVPSPLDGHVRKWVHGTARWTLI